MGEDDLGVTGPIELPARRIAPASTRRLHRLLSGTSGILLFACMFLPAVRGCNEPVVPLDMPPFWPPYLYGLVFAVVALSRSDRGVVGGAMALRVLAWLIAVGGVAMSVGEPGLGVVELALGVLMLAIIGWAGSSERRIAWTAVVISGMCIVWFGLWVSTGDALHGVILSLASSIGLFAGGIVWLFDLARTSVLPKALARDRRSSSPARESR